jgi:hypothetical protein
MSWIFTAVGAVTAVPPSMWSWLAPLLTIPNAFAAVTAVIGLFCFYFAGSKALREATAKATANRIEQLEGGINAATLRADAEEKRADAATLRAAEAERERDEALAHGAAETVRADAAEKRADDEKMRADIQTARASSMEIKNAELFNSSTADSTRHLAIEKELGKSIVALTARVAELEAQLGTPR